jgi:hypothetical protein
MLGVERETIAQERSFGLELCECITCVEGIVRR